MAMYVCNMPNMTTTVNGTTSNTLALIDDAYGLTIGCPATLTSTGVSIQVELTSTGTNFFTLQSGGVDVQMTAARATVICPVPFKQMRLVCTAAEGTVRTFSVAKTVMS